VWPDLGLFERALELCQRVGGLSDDGQLRLLPTLVHADLGQETSPLALRRRAHLRPGVVGSGVARARVVCVVSQARTEDQQVEPGDRPF